MQQFSEVNGDHNTVVQLRGDGHTVVLNGLPHLKLTRFEHTQSTSLDDSSILLATTRAIPLVGRESEIADLEKFLEVDPLHPIRVRVMTGGGGSGKTRLALELCDRIKANWNAGFVTSTALERFFKQSNASDWGWQRPTLLVLDYAASHAAILHDWLAELIDRAAPSHPLRILLLERHANPQGGWHQAAFNPGGGQSHGTRALLSPPEPVAIRPIVASLDRMAIVRNVLQLAEPQRATRLLNEQALEPQLAKSPWASDPLYLAMAALTMARGQTTQVFDLNRLDLALEVAGHEARRIKNLAHGAKINDDIALHLCACITVLGGIGYEEAMRLVGAECTASGLAVGLAPAKVADLLRLAYPDPLDDERIAAIGPDLIGEAFLLQVWNNRRGADTFIRLFSYTFPDDPTGQDALCAMGNGKVVDSLVRLVQDFSTADERPEAWFQQLIQHHRGVSHLLELIEAKVPAITVALSNINLRLAQFLSVLAQVDNTNSPHTPARRQLSLAMAYAKTGQLEAALAPAQEAKELYRALLPQDIDEVRNNYGSAVSTLSKILNELGRNEDALAEAQEAVKLFREMDTPRDDVPSYNLAMSLTYLAIVYCSLRRWRPALEAARESTSLFRKIDAQRASGAAADLANSVNSESNILSELGDGESALVAAEESVSICRALASQSRDAFEPNLAMALHTLARRLITVRRLEDARVAIEEAVQIRRSLSARQPAAFEVVLAKSLIVLAGVTEKSGDTHGALNYAHQAMRALRRHFMERPAAYGRLMEGIVREYLRLCEASQTQPDAALFTFDALFSIPPEELNDE
jgi:tetratricopeptide (TPR) repeat protein